MNKKRLCTILGFIAALNINTTNCVNVDKEAPVETKTIIELVKNVKNMVNEYLEENSKKEIFSFGYLKADSNIYDYTDSYTKVNTISKYQKVVVLSETKEYYYCCLSIKNVKDLFKTKIGGFMDKLEMWFERIKNYPRLKLNEAQKLYKEMIKENDDDKKIKIVKKITENDEDYIVDITDEKDLSNLKSRFKDILDEQKKKIIEN